MPGSWGRFPRTQQQEVMLRDRTAPLPPFTGMALPYGNGRSYGDNCLCPGGTLLHARDMDRFIRFDPATGVVECEAGVLLAEIIDLALPHGWFLPVTPGTRYVTVGGAIANDVHGKNQAVAGSFGDHVLSLELLRTDGQRRQCDSVTNTDWFRATVGGLGLTGIILTARLQLRTVPGPTLDVKTRRFGALDDFFALSTDAAHEYSVAWVDCLARGRRLGRGVFMTADHTPGEAPAAAPKTQKIPFEPPFSLVNRMSLSLFNGLYYARAPRRPARRRVHLLPYFYPLDRITNWNLMYGPKGFLQYQCVVPPAEASGAISELLDRVAASGQGSFLAVLKQFGDRRGTGLLSFPRPGTTLALDFPHKGSSTLRLLDDLDAVVVAAGGAVYPAKDARMPAATFASSFPELEQFRQYLDPRLASGLWRRVMGAA